MDYPKRKVSFLLVDKDIAALLGNCCVETYSQFENNGAFTIPSGFQLVTDFEAVALDKRRLFGFILESEKYIIIAFRGTRTDREWIADFTFEQVPFPYVRSGVEVHAGFFSIYQSCRETIFYHLAKLSQTKPLLVTGHSLGGALATLFTLDSLHSTAFTNSSLYTFGAPKVGNKLFKKLFNDVVNTSFRFVNLYDIVPLLPPTFVQNKKEPAYFHTKSLISFSYDTGSLLENHTMQAYQHGIRKMFKKQPSLTPRLLVPG